MQIETTEHDFIITIPLSEIGSNSFSIDKPTTWVTGDFYKCLRYLIKQMIDMSKHSYKDYIEIASEDDQLTEQEIKWLAD